MSAWIVSKTHIDVLVQAAVSDRFSRYGYADADRLGTMLWAENVRSVNYRYSHHTPEEVAPYTFQTPRRPRTPVEVLKAIDCYCYQTCETEDWPTTDAYRFCDSLRGTMIGRLPGYDAAEWGCDDESA